MNNSKSFILSLILLPVAVLSSSFLACNMENKVESIESETNENKKINIFVSHGHCVTPFVGDMNNFDLQTPFETNQGNPLENMKITFEIDPKTFNQCAPDELSKKLTTHGLFMSDNNDKIKFRTKDTYTVGLDWYQINGFMTIKGIEKEVTFFATGIRGTNEKWPNTLVLEGQLNLFDWEIDYDKFMTGSSDPVPTKIMRFNMKIDLSNWKPLYPQNNNN